MRKHLTATCATHLTIALKIVYKHKKNAFSVKLEMNDKKKMIYKVWVTVSQEEFEEMEKEYELMLS